MVEEARLERSEAGLAPVTDGWFVVNVRDAAWVHNDAGEAACIFEGDDKPSFRELGFTLAVLQPGQSGGLYHAESNQEDFLVLAGECLLLVEGEERPLRAWDFVHCPPATEHGFVGAGDGPCIIFMTGGRTGERSVVYLRSELALRRGIGVERETTSGGEAYAGRPTWKPGPRPGRHGFPWDSPG
jgi:uncharacterized cupin superfamily protein